MINNLDLNTLSDVILEVDSRGIIIDVNDAIYAVFGYRPNEVLGKPLSILLPDRYRANHSKLFDGFRKNPSSRRMGDISSGNFVGLDIQAKEFFIDISLSVMFNEDQSESFIAIVRDITEIISLNQRMRSTISELETKNKELEDMAYMISHDLKAPTRAITQLINFIQQDHLETLNSEAINYFTLIQKSALRMSDLIENILSYSLAGRGSQEADKIDLNEVFLEVMDSLHVPEGFRVKLLSDNLTFYANKTQFIQVLINLIGNSIKYHDKDKGMIEINAIQTLDEVEGTVKDDGPGISEKYHVTIFELFGTANEQSREDSTGVGLAIVKKIVTQNGGTINIASEIGSGSEFTFTFKTETNANGVDGSS
jgi:PAS domain S-box-containing protein